MNAAKKINTQTLVLGAVLTALVVILQYFGAAIKFGPFSVTLTLIPIVIGAAVCGTKISTFLGIVFGMMVLLTGDAAAFLPVNFAGTVLTVILKGAACGFFAGIVYNAIKKYNMYLAVFIAAFVCPVVNTGIFLLGCLAFFMEPVKEWAAAANLSGGVVYYMFTVLIGVNFIFELVLDMVLSPVIIRLLNIRKKM